MGDWQSLRAHVATSYRVIVDERERFQNPEWDGLSVWVATSRGQRLVALQRRKDYSATGTSRCPRRLRRPVLQIC